VTRVTTASVLSPPPVEDAASRQMCLAFPRKRPTQLRKESPTCGLAALNLWAELNRGRIRAGQPNVKTSPERYLDRLIPTQLVRPTCGSVRDDIAHGSQRHVVGWLRCRDAQFPLSARNDHMHQVTRPTGGAYDREVRPQTSCGRRCTGMDKGDGLVAHSGQ
jgi:hypothetical protein